MRRAGGGGRVAPRRVAPRRVASHQALLGRARELDASAIESMASRAREGRFLMDDDERAAHGRRVALSFCSSFFSSFSPASTSGKAYGSWAEVIASGSDVGGQGWNEYHETMQAAVRAGDVSDVEATAATSGADAASVLCYLDPAFDGDAPGGCPTMYFRDSTATFTDVAQHRMWVALEAASGIVSQHDYDPTIDVWWNVTNDPHGDDDAASPLWVSAPVPCCCRPRQYLASHF